MRGHFGGVVTALGGAVTAFGRYSQLYWVVQ